MDYQATKSSIQANPDRAEQGQKRLAEILTRSATDADFRQQLLSDPRAAMSAHFGKEIPESFQIRFVDAKGTPTVVLPEVSTGELSEADLEAVAGGAVPLLVWFAAGFIATAIGDALL